MTGDFPMATATKLMNADTFYEFISQPENFRRFFELERGEVIELPPPRRQLGFVCVNVGSLLMDFAEEWAWGYACCNDFGVVVEQDPDTVRGMDVGFFDDDGLELEPEYVYEPPLVGVEVLSPTDRPSHVLRRIGEYLKWGVKLVWIVDPEVRSVNVHRKGREPVTLDETDDLTGEDVLPGFRCRVADFFVSLTS